MNMSDIISAIEASGITVYDGEAATGARLPYIVVRPLNLGAEDLALSGGSMAWNNEFTAYCCGAGHTASFNVAKLLIQAVQGMHVGDSTLSTTLGYVGARVEGNYETQVTIQVHQGGI